MNDQSQTRVHGGALLAKAVEKQIHLRRIGDWKNELPERCPPILWFGDARTNKPVILTLGANPSRQEYLRDSSKKALQKVAQTTSHHSLDYLEIPENRFYLLKRGQQLADIMDDEGLQSEIIEGYNRYFSCDPYTKWFGLPKDSSYNVEGFLRGFGASFYDSSNYPFQAIHIDLFPFATLSNFTALQRLAYKDLFEDGWAKDFVRKLLSLFNPSMLILFGRTNVKHFEKSFDRSIGQTLWRSYGKSSYRTGVAKQIGIPFVGLSTNLGNPIGFSAYSLRQYGRFMRAQVADILPA